MNSGCCEFSFSSGMNYLSIYCRCLILVLTRMSCSAKILLEGTRCYMLVERCCMLVRLKVHGELRVLKVRTIMRVFF